MYIAQWFDVCLCVVLYCIEDSNPYYHYQSYPGSLVGRAAPYNEEHHGFDLSYSISLGGSFCFA